MNDLNQLLLNLNQNQNFSYNDFYVSDSNYFAFQLIETWPKWEKNIVNISGEHYSGKSHLAEIFKQKYKAFKFTEKELNDKKLKSLKVHENLIFEDFKNSSSEKLIYTLFNLVEQDNKYLIINSNIPLVKMNFKLNDLNSRVKNCILAEIKKPDDDLIFALILKNFSDMQIKIERRVIDYIVKRIDRSYRKISEFIYKVDEISLKKKKSINISIIKNLL